MTQEEKQLLLKDLYARLPYSIWGLHRGEDLPLYAIDDSGAYMVLGYDAWFDLDTVPFKPYLRPMFSMTEEEQEKFRTLILPEASCAYEDCLEWDVQIIGSGYLQIFVDDFSKVVDWLNEHHFDYRGLIDKELALEAPENMYKIE